MDFSCLDLFVCGRLVGWTRTHNTTSEDARTEKKKKTKKKKRGRTTEWRQQSRETGRQTDGLIVKTDSQRETHREKIAGD